MFEREGKVPRRAEQVQMIGHEQVIPDEPGIRRAPDRIEGRLDLGLVQPAQAVLGIDGEQHDGGTGQRDLHTLRGRLSPGLPAQRRVLIHAERMRRGKRVVKSKGAQSHDGRDWFHPVRDQTLRRMKVHTGVLANAEARSW